MNEQTQLKEGDLLAYVDGVATESVRRQIVSDPALRESAEQLHAAEQLLAAAWQRQDCPETDRLLQSQYGLLAQSQLDDIAQHLKRCAACQAEIAELVTGVPDKEPERNWLDQMKMAGKRIVHAIPQVSTKRPAFELRGMANARQLFIAEQHQIVIVVTASGDTRKIEGQVIDQADPLNDLAGEAVLIANDTVIHSSPIGPLGFFNYSDIYPRNYELNLNLSSGSLLRLEIQVA